MFGSRSFNLREYDKMAALLRQALPVEAIITHRLPLQEAEAALEVLHSAQCGKVVLKL